MRVAGYVKQVGMNIIIETKTRTPGETNMHERERREVSGIYMKVKHTKYVTDCETSTHTKIID